ncbi:MAG: aspartyl protease family protein, partial [bacterium]
MKFNQALIVSLSVILASCGSLSAQPPGAIRNQTKSIVPDLEKLGPGFAFEMTGTNHFYVEVKLNGEGPFRLIFDLGAPVTLLSNKAAKDSKTISPTKRPSFLMGMQGEGMVKEMQFGESKAKDIPVMIFDHPAITAMSEILGKRFDGILGYTFFARYRTTIDYEKKRLWFEPVRESTENVASALPDKMLNPGRKTPATEVIPRHNSIGIEIEMQPGDKSAATLPVVKIARVQPGSPAEKAGI